MENAIKKYGGYLFWTLAFISIIPLYQYYVVSDATYFYSFKYLSAPILIFSLIFPFVFMNKTISEQNKVVTFGYSLGYGVLAILFAGGLILAINCWPDNFKESVVSGKVTGTSHSKGSFFVKIKSERGKKYKLDISVDEFQGLRPGDQYFQVWRTGTLNFLYREREHYINMRSRGLNFLTNMASKIEYYVSRMREEYLASSCAEKNIRCTSIFSVS